MSSVEIVKVATAAEMDRFIRLPAKLYGADPNFVAPLLLERKEALSPKKNPYFAHAEVQLFLARRDGQDVGRIRPRPGCANADARSSVARSTCPSTRRPGC